MAVTAANAHADSFIGDIGILLLGLLDEGGVVEGLVVEGDILIAFGRRVAGFLLALRLRVGLFQGNEFGVPGLGHHRFDRARDGPRFRSGARGDDDRLEHRSAFRTDDRGVIEIVEPGAAMGTQTLRTELRLCHGCAILNGR